MEEGRPSRTALLVAALRARHSLSVAEPKILDDHLALGLTGLGSPAEMEAFVEIVTGRLASFGDRAAAEARVRRITLTTCIRSAYFEERLEEAASRGVTQVVLLGAGLDSTAYRRTDLTAGLLVFEVDYPATQDWKRARLAAMGVALPANLGFVPFDFEHQSLGEALELGGVRQDSISIFSWLGVQPYLTDEAVRSTLDVIADFPPGSELVMDLVTHREPRPDDPVEAGARQVVAAMGEAFRSAYAPDEFRVQLQDRGFGQLEILTIGDWLLRHGLDVPAGNGATVLVAAQLGGGAV